MSAIDRCLRHAASRAVDDGPSAAAQPAQGLTVVACMDARLRLDDLLGLREGDAHVLRNAGGIVTGDVIRSLAISQNLLETREVMVIQHTDCGMLGDGDGAALDAIQERTGVRPDFPLGVFPDVDASVRESVRRIESSPLLPDAEVRGFVYDVATRRLREVR